MPVPIIPYVQYFTFNGLPRNGGKVYTYAAGTLTPKATYTTAAGTVQAANPILLNSSGIPDHGSGNIGMIWIQGSYDFLVTNSDGTDPVTIPAETSFNTVAAAGSSYYQSFSGDGTTVTFSLSEPLGTDENAVLFFVDNGRQDFITNGDFATDTVWTKGAGWTIAAGVATATGAISTDISQTANATINAGQSYNVTYTVTRTAGTITPNIGGTAGVARSTSATFTETIIAGSTQTLAFNTAGFTGTLDVVSVKLVEGIGWQVVPPTQFTLNNTSITFSTAPKTGTNNIIGFAFSTLVAAASASAAAAEAFSLAANVSAIAAASQATSFTGTSTTSILIGTGSKVFTTQTAKNFLVGEFLTIASNAGPTNYMYGQVTAYNTLTGSLTVNVTVTGGSGTFADWNIALSGIQGTSGGPVSDSVYGDITVTGGGTVWGITDSVITFPKLATAAVATQAEMEAETASKLVSASLMKNHPGVAKCLAFVTYSAGVPTLQLGYNITSITDTAVGRLTITIATDFSSANWLPGLSVDNGTSANGNLTYTAIAAGSIEVKYYLNTALADPVSFSFQGYGDQ